MSLENYIREEKIDSWEGLLSLEPGFGEWIYRGHSNEVWDLEPSIKRALEKNRVINDDDDIEPENSEQFFLNEFKQRTHLYEVNQPQANDNISWFSFMQHHGTPTRLLDFTESLYIALYFALIDSTTDACIWGFNKQWVNYHGAALAAENGFDYRHGLQSGEQESMYQYANDILTKILNGENESKDELGILLIKPRFTVRRLVAQQGVFLMQASINDSFINNIKRFPESNQPVIRKIIIPKEVRSFFLKHLITMNITAESLFPGIDGFAKSLIHRNLL